MNLEAAVGLAQAAGRADATPVALLEANDSCSLLGGRVGGELEQSTTAADRAAADQAPAVTEPWSPWSFSALASGPGVGAWDRLPDGHGASLVEALARSFTTLLVTTGSTALSSAGLAALEGASRMRGRLVVVARSNPLSLLAALAWAKEGVDALGMLAATTVPLPVTVLCLGRDDEAKERQLASTAFRLDTVGSVVFVGDGDAKMRAALWSAGPVPVRAEFARGVDLVGRVLAGSRPASNKYAAVIHR
jgi:hypothetical protein